MLEKLYNYKETYAINLFYGFCLCNICNICNLYNFAKRSMGSIKLINITLDSSGIGAFIKNKHQKSGDL